MSLDLKQLCRICLQSEKETIDIYTSFYAKKNIVYSQMICSCTKLRPYEEDGLPRLICKECARLLKRTYSFNIQCEDSDKKLRLILENGELCPDKKLTRNTIEECKDYLKEEIKCEIEVENNWSKETEVLLENLAKEELDNVIKSESYETDVGDDTDWDAEDDNILLTEIKSKTKVTKNWDAEDDNILLTEIKSKTKVTKNLRNGEIIKKKRGRKKKVLVEGESAVAESKLPHQCDECGKILSTRSNLNVHKISHTDQRPHKCETCGATFRGYSALYQHRKMHSGEKPYHCEYCSKQFSRRTGLVNHIKIHTGEKQYSCDICFKNFVQSAQLSIHMKRHKGDKTYLCQDCGKGFPIRSDLKVHQRIHNGEKPYSCQLCPKTFATSGNLSIHTRIHNKEVRYNCQECNRGFVTCSAYNVHLKRHKGQKDYLCDCGKTFYTSSALKQHKVVHTGERKYQCKICEKKFSQTSHLNRHFKRDHMKPNMPLPASEHYRVIVNESKVFFGNEQPNSDVKCEGT